MWIMKIAFLILASPLVTQTVCQSHYGTEFIFGIPHNAHDEQYCSELMISIASRFKGTYNLSIPFLNVDDTGSFENMREITLNCSLAKFGNFTEKRGIYLKTSKEVAVYATNYHKDSADTFLILPVSRIGQHYRVAATTPDDQNETSFIMIVARSSTTNGYIDNGQHLETFTLNQLDVFQYTTIRDIQGMSVTANKPVTVITGTTCSNIPQLFSACDVIIEQMIPFQSLDNVYIAAPTPPKKGYELKVTHFNNSEFDTTCFHNISGTICTNTSAFTIRMGTAPTVIVSKNTISVTQFGFGNGYLKAGIGDPFMTVVQGVRNYLNSYSFAIPSVYKNATNQISIIIPKVDINGLLLDGSNLTEKPKDIFDVSKPLDNYTVLILSVSSGYHHINHVNAVVKFGMQVYGTFKYLGYGYPGGMGLSIFETLETSSTSTKSALFDVTSLNLQTDTAPNNDTNGTEILQKHSNGSTIKISFGILLGTVFGAAVCLSLVALVMFAIVKRKKIGKSSVRTCNKVNSGEPSNTVWKRKK